MAEMSKKIFFMFFIFGGYVKSPKGKKKIKATRDFIRISVAIIYTRGGDV